MIDLDDDRVWLSIGVLAVLMLILLLLCFSCAATNEALAALPGGYWEATLTLLWAVLIDLAHLIA